MTLVKESEINILEQSIMINSIIAQIPELVSGSVSSGIGNSHYKSITRQPDFIFMELSF